MLISPIGLLEPIQNQDQGIIPGYSGNPYRFIHTKCPLSHMSKQTLTFDSIQDWTEAVYKDLHQHPELSMQEVRTRRRICEELEAMGIDPIEIGGGVVGTLERGEGATVMMRADFDALSLIHI